MKETTLDLLRSLTTLYKLRCNKVEYIISMCIPLGDALPCGVQFLLHLLNLVPNILQLFVLQLHVTH